MTAWGIRAPCSRTPPEARTADANGSAQTSSQISNAADELGSSCEPMNSTSSGSDQAADLAGQLVEAGQVELIDLKGQHVSLGILADEDEVEDPYGA